MKKARLLVLDVIGGTGFYEKECSELQDFYDALKCRHFDIAYRKVGGKYFDIFCDDEGLFVKNPIPSALDGDMEPALVGNLIFAHHDSAGNTTRLSDEDIRHIKEHAVTAIDYDSEPMKMWNLVTQVEY